MRTEIQDFNRGDNKEGSDYIKAKVPPGTLDLYDENEYNFEIKISGKKFFP